MLTKWSQLNVEQALVWFRAYMFSSRQWNWLIIFWSFSVVRESNPNNTALYRLSPVTTKKFHTSIKFYISEQNSHNLSSCLFLVFSEFFGTWFIQWHMPVTSINKICNWRRNKSVTIGSAACRSQRRAPARLLFSINQIAALSRSTALLSTL
jgi:hypothetical protein